MKCNKNTRRKLKTETENKTITIGTTKPEGNT